MVNGAITRERRSHHPPTHPEPLGRAARAKFVIFAHMGNTPSLHFSQQVLVKNA
jgi:hypothetical protein